jgi:predicted nucleotidyltransferase
MRLTQNEIQSIKQLAQKHFGNDTKVFLFGSRTDDKKKGGDIDLFIKTTERNVNQYQQKIRFLVDLELSIGEQKIDVILDSAINHESGIFNSIYKTAIQL